MVYPTHGMVWNGVTVYWIWSAARVEFGTGGICVCVLFTRFLHRLAISVHKHLHSGALSSRPPTGLITSGHKSSKSFWTSIKLLLCTKSSMNHPLWNISSINSACHVIKLNPLKKHEAKQMIGASPASVDTLPPQECVSAWYEKAA